MGSEAYSLFQEVSTKGVVLLNAHITVTFCLCQLNAANAYLGEAKRQSMCSTNVLKSPPPPHESLSNREAD